ncbi:MAG: alpha/beta hydrolase [Nitrosomonas sp.]|nr:alpha/beta hydrolase [Nitrosomonas sp.]
MNIVLPSIQIETKDHPTHSIIWMHGLGADGNDFVPIINELKLLPDTAARFIFPHAPELAVSINNGYVMRAWYDILDPSMGNVEDEAGIRHSQAAICALIEQETQRGILPKNIILAGFSQGGVMALQVGLRYKKEIGGIIALSCYLPLPYTLEAEISHANRNIPIFMVHGKQDAVIPISRAEESREKLRQSGYTIEWHEYDMEHSVCVKEILDISEWLNLRFKQ